MSALVLKKSQQLLALAMGLVFTAATYATVTSEPTGTVVGTAPTVVNPAVISFVDVDANGVVNDGDTLAVAWDLANDVTDPDGDTVTEAAYEWFAGSTSIGTGNQLTLLAEHMGQAITVKATAKTDESITDPFESEATLAVVDSSIPGVTPGGNEIPVVEAGAVVSVAIAGLVDGSPKVGVALTAEPTCIGACDSVTYQWQIESAVGSGSFVDIAGATTDTYMPVRTDQKRKVQVIAE